MIQEKAVAKYEKRHGGMCGTETRAEVAMEEMFAEGAGN